VVYNGSCQSTANATMASAFLGSGAGSYLGFSKVVNSNFAQSVAQQFFTEMVTNGDTTSEAFATVTPLVDPAAPFAVFQRSGLDELAYGSEFENGGFEEGLTAWSVDGDGRVIAVLAEYSPTEGDFMGIISTGLGFTTTSGALSQTFCLNPGADRLEFDWNYFSEEFVEWCGPQHPYNDPFEVVISWPGSSLVIFYEDVDSLCSSVVPTNVSFDQGGVYSTGWRSASIDISAIAAAAGGAAVTVTFRSYDLGDSIFDTAILLDRIRVVNLP
jgi:hypothetical protein